ncbi:unnamed protein product [Orchesella dallaii]|uniref:Uncharacterized protein n=1 Tax=Orchesella dallaii TaxID=48710 RepID=A0ABP1RFR0_9HEXA
MATYTQNNHLKLISSHVIVFIIVLISLVNWGYCDNIKNYTHESSPVRHKRFLWITHDRRLIFPPGTLLDLKFTLQVPFLRKEAPPNGIHSDIQLTTFFYIIFDELGITHGSHPWPPFYPFGSLFGPSKRSIKTFDMLEQRSGKLQEKNHVLSLPSTAAFPGGERALIYPKLESFLASVGWQGRPCLLRLVCETHEYPLKYGYGLLGEMFTLFFTASHSPFAESHLPSYLEAEEMGLAGNCSKYLSICEKSFFKWERKQNSKLNDVDFVGKDIFNNIIMM